VLLVFRLRRLGRAAMTARNNPGTGGLGPPPSHITQAFAVTCARLEDEPLEDDIRRACLRRGVVRVYRDRHGRTVFWEDSKGRFKPFRHNRSDPMVIVYLLGPAAFWEMAARWIRRPPPGLTCAHLETLSLWLRGTDAPALLQEGVDAMARAMVESGVPLDWYCRLPGPARPESAPEVDPGGGVAGMPLLPSSRSSRENGYGGRGGPPEL
jgi:hypothetical protein